MDALGITSVKRSRWISALSLAGAVTLLAGCGALERSASERLPSAAATPSSSDTPPSSDTPQDPPPPEDEPAPSPEYTDPHSDTRVAIASVKATAEDARIRDVAVDLVGLNRLGADHVVIQVRLSKTTDSRKWYLWHDVHDYMTKDKDDMASGLGLIDVAQSRILMPSATPEGACLCTVENDFEGPGLEYGKPRTLYAVVPAPAGGASSTTVYLPFAPPIVNVPISDEPPVPPPGQEIPDPADHQLTPLSYPMEIPSVSLDRSQETTTDDKRVRINLSSDVLFKVNKADLSAKAQQILQRTATSIDTSDAGTVKIDGHADATGDDAVNDPLSTRRAQAVRARLTSLVSREGVRFTAEGHGSREPLYPNDTKDGQRRNRRVTVTFDRPRTSGATGPTGTPVPLSSGGPGSSATTNVDGQPFTVEVDPVRTIGGGLGVLTYRTTNNGIKSTWLHELSRKHERLPASGRFGASSNVDLVDPATQTMYGPVGAYGRQGDRLYCVCTAGGTPVEKHLAQETKEFWALIGVPEQATTVRVRIADFPPLADIPIR
ncbi:OmpA family protein [Nonomuraea cavernae]|uniref:OmpA family protein n=1 Tax=Nonomuraea cavernae TaxID=2045107 RepID=UPI0033DF0753